MNEFERDVVWQIANLTNVRLWHHNISTKGFYINGSKRLYPDINVMAKSGKVLLFETKGNHLEVANQSRSACLGVNG